MNSVRGAALMLARLRLESIYTHSSSAGADITNAAGMMLLWGYGRPYRRWLSREANGDVATTELLFHAYRERQAHFDRRASEMFGFDVAALRRRS